MALALAHRWNPDNLFVILTAYLDEAGTDGRYPFFVVGGYISTVAKWNDFDRRWKKLLRKGGLSHFHAMDFRPENEPFNKWPPGVARQFLAAIERLILTRTLFGFVARLEVADYQEHYWGPGPIKGLQLDSKYGICLRVIMSFLETILTEHFGDDFRVNIVLESGDKSIGVGDAVRVFNQLKQHIPDAARHFGTLTFADKRDFPGLQAADSTVSPAHRIERDGEAEFSPFVEGETLAGSREAQGKVAPVYRFHIDARILKEMRENLATWKEYRRNYWQSGVSRQKPSEGVP